MADLCGLRSDPAYLACVEILEAAGIQHELVPGAKHAQLRFTYKGKEFVKTLSYGGRTNWRNVKNAAADIKRTIRKANKEAAMLAATTSQAEGDELRAAAIPNVFVRDGEVLTTSKDVAGYFEKQHQSVLAAIENLLQTQHGRILGDGYFRFQQSAHPTIPGRKDKWFLITQKGFSLIGMGFTGPKALDFKVRYIERFEQMKVELSALAAVPITGPSQMTPADLATLIGGVCKVVMHKQLEPIAAGQELALEGIAALNARVNALEGQRALPAPAAAMVTAFEVVSRMAEVPGTKMFAGLPGQVSARLNRYCARHGYQVGIVDLRPGEKLTFPRDAAVEWLSEGGGRKEIWVLVEAHAAKKSGQIVLPFRQKS